ncbi:SAM-dependent methyltransferase [Halobacteriales archaeon QH_2_65_14]|nr:MAG: SAM-dependent methyltransferase [Halobacteriales archaeon QH_2_65_14]
MNEDQRRQVRENAKYLQAVRPIDPGEIHEYVEGVPHPAAVRQVLREKAPALGLIERADGRFEPVADGPMEATVRAIDRLPEGIFRTLEDALVEQYGPGWPDGESGEALRSAIRDFKRRYLLDAPVTYDERTALGYAIYHLPPYFAAVQYALGELLADGLVPNHLRVLDVGAGVGGPALGIDALVPDDALVEYHAVEPSQAAAVCDTLLETTGRNFHPTVHRLPIEEFERGDQGEPEEFDLVLCANVLSELDDPEGVLAGLLDRLTPEGTVLALAPADRNTAIQLREIERTVEEQTDATKYAPTVRLWPGKRPESTSWSFRRHPDLDVPGFQRRLDEGRRTDAERACEETGNRETDGNQSGDSDHPGDTDGTGARPVPPAGSGEFVNVDVQYAYSLLRRDGKTAVEFRPDPGRFAPMATMDEHVTDRIDCVGIKLSHDLAEGGNPLYLVGDGSQHVDHFAVVTSESALNRDLGTAEYGDLLVFENVLVLWNDDERAYNLVVDGETVVERIPA